MLNKIPNIEWACDYVDDDGIRYDTWYCNSCNTDIDDKVQEMEMHECKKNDNARQDKENNQTIGV